MSKYRITEIFSNNEIKYRVKKKWLFFWVTMTFKEEGFANFHSQKEAEEWIKSGCPEKDQRKEKIVKSVTWPSQEKPLNRYGILRRNIK